MTIDIYTHIFPGDFYAQMTKAAPRLENIGKRMSQVTMIQVTPKSPSVSAPSWWQCPITARG